jgi:hypothetical protein
MEMATVLVGYYSSWGHMAQELDGAKFQGKRVAEITTKLHG